MPFDDIITDPRFWDCECKNNYIHEKRKQKACAKCDTTHSTQPDSRVNELKTQGFIK